MKTLFDGYIQTLPASSVEKPKPSYAFDQKDIIRAIINLHCPDGIEVDATFGNGGFYSPNDLPKISFDIDPQQKGVIKANSIRLPLPNDTVSSVMFDPPFITYVNGARDHNSIMSRRFGGYYSYGDLEKHYRQSIEELFRVIRPSGFLIFKCQDVIHNHRFHATHVNVANWAESTGFRVLDMFVLVAENRMPGPQKGQQRHARIHQSFFWVFQKRSKRRNNPVSGS